MKTEKKLKILAASDLHGNSSIVLKLAKKADKENVDIVVLCGDITGFSETKNLISPFKEKNKKVLIIPGNHDSHATIDFLASLYKIRNLHGYSVKYNNIGFFGAGGADIGPWFISDEEIFKTLKRAHDGLNGIEKKIMITHMHPRGSLSEFSGFLGSNAIAKAIKEFKPDILLNGHIHEAEGMEELMGNTRVISVGRNGTILEI